MRMPEHPARPAFQAAADATEGWRQHQIAALTETQHRLYEQAKRKAEEKEKTKASELAERRQADIQERMRKKLLEHRDLQFNFRGRRTRMTEIVARRLIEEHFQRGRPPDHLLYATTLERFERDAAAEVDRDHARQLNALRQEEREKLDRLLRRFERGREQQPQNRQDFAHAATSGKARTDFQRSAKDDAIARAFARVARKEEDERQRGDRGRGREHGKE